MKVIKRTSESEIATVFIAENSNGKFIEFVESTQPPLTIKDKWVLIISTLCGCPVNCTFCDAGGSYSGLLNYDELKYQIDYLINYRFPDGIIQSDRLKIQFARMGEPAFNPDVLKLLRNIPQIYNYKSFTPSLSTIAPESCSEFFEELLMIKNELYEKEFQLQFSIHSTDNEQRNQMIPIKKWSFDKIAKYSERFFTKHSKKITLNFILSKDTVLEPEVLSRYFNPDMFILKISPLNPTYKAQSSGLVSAISEEEIPFKLLENLKDYSYEIILNIGEWEENKIGSNCGQYIKNMNNENQSINAYSYDLVKI